jgi:hypothetical protein
MLERHSIVTSYLDQKSYWELKDNSKYDKASLLYEAMGGSPYTDLRHSFETVCRGWELRRAARLVGKKFHKENSIIKYHLFLFSLFDTQPLQ